MAAISNREEFKDYCLRRLGFPVVNINIDDEQVEDRIDDALQYWTDYHFDATQKVYYIKAITQQDINRRYIDMSPDVTMDSEGNKIDIVGVTRIFPIQDSQASINMFDLRYQLRLNELYDFTSASYINYTLTMQHLRSLELMFSGEIPIRFQRHMNKLFIDWNWGSSYATSGRIIVAECYAALDPEVYKDVWTDRWLKRYATALIKRQWAENMKKFGGIQLLGGVTLNGDQLYMEAVKEIDDLENDMERSYGGVPEFMMG